MLGFAACAALALVAAFAEPLRALVLACDLAFVGACAWDVFATPRPDALTVRRRLPPNVGLDQDFARSLRIEAERAPRAAGLELSVHERFAPDLAVRARTVHEARAHGPGAPAPVAGVPRGLAAPAAGDPSGGPDVVRLPRAGPIDVVRVYRASRRGVHALGDLRLRLVGPLGLVARQSRLAGGQEIEVRPAMLGLSRTLKLAASERWRDLGVRRLPRRGGRTEFESLREYVEGDDRRMVDWKATARRARPIVRQFQEERGQELVVVVDCGRRMGATSAPDEARASGVAGWTKLDHALDAGLQIAAVALTQGDRAGVMAYDANVRAWVPPARGRGQLAKLEEAVFALQPSEKDSDLERALRELGTRHRRRALVLVLSDVADPLSVERQRAALAAGSSRHKIVFAGLDDPSLRAAAAGHEDAGLRAAAATLQRERRGSLRSLGLAGVRVLDTLPAEAAAPLLAAWLAARREL